MTALLEVEAFKGMDAAELDRIEARSRMLEPRDGSHLGSSIYLRDILGSTDGPPPEVDLFAERRNGNFVRSVIRNGQATACHDISSGGLALALAEMAMSSGKGLKINLDPEITIEFTPAK